MNEKIISFSGVKKKLISASLNHANMAFVSIDCLISSAFAILDGLVTRVM